MIIVGTFRYSLELEQALSDLETLGINRDQLLVVCMDSDAGDFLSLKQRAAGSNSNGIEIGLACATALSVIGSSVGFILSWGPVIWGLITAFIGFGLGFGINAVFRKYGRQRTRNNPEITVIVQCKTDNFEHVQKVMWSNHALTVGHAHASTE
ncbi:hypothetical protein V3851_23070 [Paenibacillus sp. M1]|uniref:Uncharacterized protein n=1 Tax=Paenibacillus haidiansis TaxID=1574488 RepID=A0ABU7W0K5_9BACL